MNSERAFSEHSMATAKAMNNNSDDESSEYQNNNSVVSKSRLYDHHAAAEEGNINSNGIATRLSRTVPQDSTLSEPEQEGPLTCYERVYSRYLLLFFMSMTNFFLFFDRGALTSMVTDIRNDKEIAGGDHKSLSETQGSLVVSAYMVGFVLSGPVCSALGRVVNARWIMAVGLVIVVAMTFLTGYATSYGMLLTVRAVSGVGEAAVGAYFLTMVDNIATPKTRTAWIGVYLLAIPSGMAIGTAASGYIASSVNFGDRAPWRISFYLAAICLAPFALLTMFYPARFSPTAIGLKKSGTSASAASPDGSPLLAGEGGGSASVSAKHEHASPWDAVKRLATNKLYMCLVIAMGAFMLVAGGNSILTQPMLRFGPWKMSQAQASTLTAIIAVPSVIGSVVGGAVLDRFGGSAGRRGLFRCCRHLAMMSAISVPIIVSSLFVYSAAGYAILQVVGFMALMTVIAPSSAAILTAVDKDVRTYAMSYATIFERLIALPGPTIIGYMADYFSDGCHENNFQHMCDGTDPTNVTTAVTTTGIATTTTAMFPTTSALELLLDNVTTTVTDLTTTFLTSASASTTAVTDGPTTSPAPSEGNGCVWVPGKQGSNGSCMNEFEGRNAIAFYSTFYIIAIVGWLISAIIAYKKSLVAMAAHAAAVAEAEAAAAAAGEKEGAVRVAA